MTPSEEHRLSVIETKLDGIAHTLECLPAVCESVNRQDERLKAVERDVGRIWGRIWWAIGLAATATLSALSAIPIKLCGGTKP